MSSALNAFAKNMMITSYSLLNITIEDFSCPTKKKSDDSSQEDDSSCKICDCLMDKKNYKNCFSKTLVDETNNYCCFGLISMYGLRLGACMELQKKYICLRYETKTN